MSISSIYQLVAILFVSRHASPCTCRAFLAFIQSSLFRYFLVTILNQNVLIKTTFPGFTMQAFASKPRVAFCQWYAF
jgi:hypothetical protein